MTNHAYILSGARTPIGNFLGSLSALSAVELGARSIEAAVERSGLDVNQFDEVIMGNVLATGLGQAPARQSALAAGLNPTIAAVTVNKVCGSGLKSVMMAAQAIRCGDANAVVAGGMESMSNVPHYARRLRTGQKLGDLSMVDTMIADGLTCGMESCHMGMHAEYTATKWDVTRQQQDAFAAESQRLAAAAWEQGWFNDEIVKVTVKSRKGESIVETDECVRGDTTADGLAKLRPAFDKTGSVTAGNASTLSDGAAAVVVTNEEIAQQSSAPVKARILAYHTSGGEPKDLFVAPVAAVQGALKKANLSADEIDIFEINEAFAAQMLACLKQLNLDPSKVNPQGGGISIGHPIGASGARCLVTLMHTLNRVGGRLGVVSLCLGGGNAVAMVIERQS